MNAVEPGFVVQIHAQPEIVVFLFRDKEINGVAEPDPEVFSCTPKSVLKLKQITKEKMVTQPEPEVHETYESFVVFGNFTLIWISRSIFEGAFAGRSITLRGPYLLVE